MSRTEMTNDIRSMRVDGAWVLMPLCISGRDPDMMEYQREANDECLKMPLSRWLKLPLYEVRHAND